jgi:hypothetical protein
VPDEGFSRHASSTLILISTFSFIVVKTFVTSVSWSNNVYLTSTKKNRLTEDFHHQPNLYIKKNAEILQIN